MAELTQAERYLLDRIRRGEPDGWSQLVDRYQGRQLAFAQSRLASAADAEDVVQETFIAFLKSLGNYRGQAGIETYLFAILRRKIADHIRGRRTNVCRIQDTVGVDGQEARPLEEMASPDPTASWYVRRDEQRDLQREALAEAVGDLVTGYRESGDLRGLETFELLFYCQLRNKDVARITGLSEKQVALLKHRGLKRIRQRVAKSLPGEQLSAASDAMLTEVWEQLRPSCPKRSTIGAYSLGTLEQAWHQYVEFHLQTVGCGFCLANLADLQRQTAGPQRRGVHDRIMQSTVGFLRQT